MPGDGDAVITDNTPYAAAAVAEAVDRELPFLVTHWLSHYGEEDGCHAAAASSCLGGVGRARVDGEGREESLRRIRLATTELASAFSALGAYGTVTGPLVSGGPPRPATFYDLARRHASIPPSHLGSVAVSGATATAAVRAVASVRSRRSSALEKALEGGGDCVDCASVSGQSSGEQGGRRVGAAASGSSVTGGGNSSSSSSFDLFSILQPPAVLSAVPAPPKATPSPPPSPLFDGKRDGPTPSRLYEIATAAGSVADEARDGASLSTAGAPLPKRQMTVALQSDWDSLGSAAARASREHVTLRTRHWGEEREIARIRSVVSSRMKLKEDTARQRHLADAIVAGGPGVAAAAAEVAARTAGGGIGGGEAEAEVELDLRALESRDRDAERVIAQMGRKLEQLLFVHCETGREMDAAAGRARALQAEFVALQAGYEDPFDREGSAALPVPFSASGSPRPSPLLSTVMSRPYCGSFCSPGLRSSGRFPSPACLTRIRKQLLSRRLSHSVTISCHLFYPVYCLRFDRTGQYFVTGADDHLVKLFHLGAGISSGPLDAQTGYLQSCYGANAHGAVLVCSLRGHAGVITDIDVSTDNAMLATASEDGDVRVWGMRDGSPIAILRGHTGGANMVTWTALCPYRIITSGQDGLARIWDVREAALKRYGSVIGKRADYALPKKRLDRGQVDEDSFSEEEEVGTEEDAEEEIALPPLPLRQPEEGSTSVVAESVAGRSGETDGGDANGDGNGVFVPPLPPGAEGLPVGGGNGVILGADNSGNGNNVRVAAGGGNNANALPQPGAFVSGDAVDQGVVLLAKMQHGDIAPSSQLLGGPSTRSQRKKVNVICLSQCPIGGHFATGSDDGLGRIWAIEDDEQIERLDYHRSGGSFGELETFVDMRKSDFSSKRQSGRLKRQKNVGNINVVPSKSSLLATLAGHLHSITDVQYSNAGDRILTASQKDGVVRIWSWGNESACLEHLEPGITSSPKLKRKRIKFDNIKQILIRLTVPPDFVSEVVSNSSATRRRGGSSASVAALDVSCDVAIWSSDDSKVITSQTCLIKAGGADIVPGSHVLYVWESRSGRCLTGIPSAHAAPCPVLTCHPSDSSILASAGGDGKVNVWDLDTGKRIFEHRNLLMHGPVDPPTNRGKIAGYLDGCFSPDGLYLVLTDDSGRVTVVDTLLSAEDARKPNAAIAAGSSPAIEATEGTQSNPISVDAIDPMSDPSRLSSAPPTAPCWMNEQYFANDYYDLFYDSNGYCIERGSEQPPHLAPRAARCNHMGEAHSALIGEAFSKMAGPRPLMEEAIRWHRTSIRKKRLEVCKVDGLLGHNVHGKRAAINGHITGRECHVYESSFDSLLRKIGADLPLLSDAKVRQALSAVGTLSGDSGRRNPSTQSARALSSRYRWIGYEDIREDPAEIEEEDDDEEYQEAPRGRRLQSDDEASNVSDVPEEEMVDVDLSDGEVRSPRASRSSSRRLSARRSLGGSGRRRSSSQRGGRTSTVPAARSERRERRSRDRGRSVAFEEQQRVQPTRVSARQMTQSPSRQRRRYEIPDSSDDDLIEEMSTNRTPHGEFVEDYTVRGHLFRLPERGVVQRKWVCRTESKGGLSGRKTYSPQVGDSVIYIPRAHYETIREFPSVDNSVAPWKSWPTTCSWPVVQCSVRNVRYRFPYENYYRNRRGKSCTSIVAVLTLEVTGIPQIASDRSFPWPKPEFISRLSRSTRKTFELSVFTNDLPEFLVPEHLYVWKIQQLESALRSRDGDFSGFELVSFYEPSEGEEGYGTEDPELIPFKCTLTGLTPEDEDEFHFQSSGYNVLDVLWDCNGDTNACSTWEVFVNSSMNLIPHFPKLHEDEKAALLKILDKLEEDRKVRMYFTYPVNTTRYSDYLNMIEVPMDLQFIRQRLDEGYYTNKLSFLSDVKLIKENCLKYNDEGNELSTRACELYDTVHEMIDDLPDYPRPRLGTEQLVDTLQSPKRTSLRTAQKNDEPAQNTASETPSPLRTSRTRSSARLSERNNRAAGRSRQSSSLENLPVSARANTDGQSVGQPLNSRRRIRISLGRAAVNSSTPEMVRATRSTRSSRRPDLSDDNSSGASAEEANSNDENEEAHKTSNENEKEARESKDIESDCSSSPRRKVAKRSRNYPVSSSARSAVATRRSAARATISQDSLEAGKDKEQEDDHGRTKRRCTRSSRSLGELCNGDSSDPTQQNSVATGSSPGSSSNNRYAEWTDISEAGTRTRRPQKALRYEEVGSSDFYSEEESEEESADDVGAKSDSSEEIVASSDRCGRSSTKRCKAVSSKGTGAAKRSRAFSEAAPRCEFYPKLPRWPPVVPIKKITKVSKRIIDIVSEKDTDNLFSRPVAEEYPDMADAYLNAVAEPMDFRTIMEVHIPRYNDMAELQDHIILTYRNCCTFNGEGNKFYSYAIDRWKNLNNIFKDVCEEEGILLPRRWR